MEKNICVIGLGYVGLSNAILLSQKNKVYAYDNNPEKIKLLKLKQTPFSDKYISEFLSRKKLNLIPTDDFEKAVKDSSIVIIATPTDFDDKNNNFNTSSIEFVIERIISLKSSPLIVIKSTVPIGYSKSLIEKYNYPRILFSPEFLREGNALYDCLYPSRIIIGGEDILLNYLLNLFVECSDKDKIETLITSTAEAESIKLFSNAYLALRVSFINELDTFCEIKELNPKKIIKGLGYDPRIGNFYNNPSFGYGGYCLPKDSKQLLCNYINIPNKIIKSIVDSNQNRKEYIANNIQNLSPSLLGIYRIVMKSGSDNYRSSSIIDIMKILVKKGIKIIIYEPSIKEGVFMNCEVINNLKEFKDRSNLILANRINSEIYDSLDKVYTRDLFESD